MPWTLKTKDGITLNNVPDDIPPDSQVLKDRVAKLRAERDGSPVQTPAQAIPGPGAARMAVPQTGSLGEELTNPESWRLPSSPEEALSQLGQNVGVATRGAVSGGASMVGLVADPIVNLINSATKGDWPTLSQSLTNLMNQLGVPEPQSQAQKLLQNFTGAATGTGGMIKAGQSMAQGIAPTVSKGVGEVLSAQPVQQLGGAAGSSVAAQVAEEAGADPLTQLGAGLVGGVLGSKAAGARVNPLGKEIPDALQAAEDRGVKVLTSDVFQPKGVVGKSIQTLSERNPFLGSGAVRAEQQKQRGEAVRDLLNEFGASDMAKASDSVMTDLAAKRSAKLGEYTGWKNEVLDKLSEGGKPVPVNKTVEAIDKEILDLQGLKTEGVAPVIKTLEDWKGALLGGEGGQSLKNIEILRKQIGEQFKAPELAASKSVAEKALSRIYGPLKDDIGAYIKANGNKQDVAKWNIANARLSEMMGDLKLDALKSTLKKGDATPEVVQKMLFSQKPSEVEMLYKNLSPDGRANARAAILAKAAKESVDADTVSPEKFAKKVKDLGTSVGVFFTGDDLAQVQGLMKTLSLTRRAAEASANPATGIQTLIPTSGVLATSAFGGGVPGFLGAMATATGAGALTRLYESKAARDLFIQLGRVKSPKEEAALLKRLVPILSGKPETPGKVATQLSDIGGQMAPQELIE